MADVKYIIMECKFCSMMRHISCGQDYDPKRGVVEFYKCLGCKRITKVRIQ